MDRKPQADRLTRPGSPDYFTGAVTIAPVIDAPAPARVQAAVVTFAPGARTAWHTHPLGQTLLILSGTGLCQTDGGPVVQMQPGDRVWFGPDERHWHGAGPDTPMTHLAIQEALEGVSVVWLEQVSDACYRA